MNEKDEKSFEDMLADIRKEHNLGPYTKPEKEPEVTKEPLPDGSNIDDFFNFKELVSFEAFNENYEKPEPIHENIDSEDLISVQTPSVTSSKKKKTNKKKQKRDVKTTLLYIVSLIAVIGSLLYLGNEYILQPYLTDKQNNELSGIISEDTEPEKVVENLDNIENAEKIKKFNRLKEINSDFLAWLVVPGGNVNLPVVQTTDNDKYMKAGFNKQWLFAGTTFVDYQNDRPFEDRNTVLYAHNMRDGTMFGDLKNYKEIDTFKKNPLIHVYTEEKDYTYKIFAVFVVSADASEDNGNIYGYRFKNLSTSDSFAAYMEDIKTRSFYDTGVDYQKNDKIITLSTCDKTVLKEGRLVIVGRLIREGESEFVDTSKAKINTMQRYPAAWYSKKRIENPYENAPYWMPS